MLDLYVVFIGFEAESIGKCLLNKIFELLMIEFMLKNSDFNSWFQNLTIDFETDYLKQTELKLF